VRTKRGYLASVLLAGVMIAGYLGMLPLLQSLAAEPSWPEAPPAVASANAAPLVVTLAAPAVALSQTQPADSKPAKVKKAKKNNAKAAKRTTPRTGSPARATGSNSNANSNAGSGGATNFGSGGGSGGFAGDDGGTCAGC
jgi:hypothetical protein